RGKYLGEFDGDDKILTVLSGGVYELTSFDLNNHFDDKMILIEKYDPEKVYSVIHIDGKSKNYLVKRFKFENTVTGKLTSIISDESGSKMVLISGAAQAIVKIEQLKGKGQTPETQEADLAEVVDVKGMKAMGNRLSQHPIKKVELIAENNPENTDSPDDDGEDDKPGDNNTPDYDNDPDDPNEPDLDGPTSPAAQSPEELEEPHQKHVDFEITNPDDIDMDDTGQLGLF
ncbi:MAG TPA: DNA gyrase/topoisomerase IV subunit A, partial [Mucilaginibacter sp.]